MEKLKKLTEKIQELNAKIGRKYMEIAEIQQSKRTEKDILKQIALLKEIKELINELKPLELELTDGYIAFHTKEYEERRKNIN